MLRELHIRNYALFEDVQIQLGPGFNVFSGETGAGKSLLVGAIGLLLGNKGESANVRRGCSEAEVIGQLSIAEGNREARAWLAGIEISLEENLQAGHTEMLTVRRILKSNGKNSCYIQHIPLTLSKLGEFMGLLFDLHSQHQNQSLSYSRNQLQMLDRYADAQTEALTRIFLQINCQKKQMEDTKARLQEQRERAAYLQEVVEEIDTLRPQQDEDILLSEQIEQLSNAQSIREQLEQSLQGGYEALALLQKACSGLSRIEGQFKSVNPLLGRLESANIEIGDILDSCKAEKNALQLDPERLQTLNQRLNALIMLNRKYGNASLNKTLEFSVQATAELAALESSEDTMSEQQQQLEKAEKQLMQQAHALSRQRKKYAPILEKRIEQNLHRLGMAQARFRIELSHSINENGRILCHNYGIDKIRFLLAANPGEELREIRQVASGGEISRIMLAIKSESISPIAQEANQHRKPNDNAGSETIIFDEIDSGIGGETAIQVAQHIHQLGQHRQILCVTHLASIAAAADTHVKIVKHFDVNITNINIYLLSGAKRISELARMLSGDEQNPKSLAHAQELLGRYP